MASWARPGVKCVCVDDNYIATLVNGAKIPSRHLGTSCPSIGDIVTIRSISDEGGLRFQEHDNAHVRTNNGAEVSFAAHRFRPLVSQSDDVALFTHLLTSSPIVERV